MGLNYKNAKGFGEARPAGWYPISLEKVEAGPSKSSGREQFAVVAQITKGDFLNGKFYDYLPIDPEATGAEKTKKFLLAFGIDIEDVEPQDVAEKLVGLQGFVKVSRRMGKDQDGEPKMENRIVQYASEDPGEEMPTKDDLERIEAKDRGEEVEEKEDRKKTEKRVPAALAARANQAAKGKNGVGKQRR